MNLTAGKIWGMRRMADSNGFFKMIAVDQRPPISNPIAKYLGTEKAPWQEVARFKNLLIKTLQQHSTAMLLDPYYAIPSSIDLLSPAIGLVVTLEDSQFTETSEGRISTNIDNWSVAKIKRMGADAVKVLAWYRPDAAQSICQKQQDYVKRIGAQCADYDIPFLLELLVYPLPMDKDQSKEYIEMNNKKSDLVLSSVDIFSSPDYGVDIFKLESPVNANNADGSNKVQELFNELGHLAGRPWVMLSAGAGKKDFYSILQHAYKAGASGYLAGRAIWLDAFNYYPHWEKIESELKKYATDYLDEIINLTDSNATAWNIHSCYGKAGSQVLPSADFCNEYHSFING